MRTKEITMPDVKTRLVTLIVTHETELHGQWTRRTASDTPFASLLQINPARDPVRLMLQDLRRVLEGKLPAANIWPGASDPPEIGPCGAWRIGLCQGIELVLLGETVVRDWAYHNLQATGTEYLELFEALNRATHRLIRFYALRYCETC